ncbi:hypothetical protein HDG33_005959 [Paraburkholderia sp. Cpub6]|nr:hypothetical protein [Paraburkholderia sp. Cpub6]
MRAYSLRFIVPVNLLYARIAASTLQDVSYMDKLIHNSQP